jgi:acetylornithine deacetylase/succinyl-diaminopimelate desuccinylase-like protein
MDRSKTMQFVDGVWEESIIPTLEDYIRIPNKSPAFDPQWQEHGHMEKAVQLIGSWCVEQPIDGLTVDIVRLEGRTPIIYMEVPGTGQDTVLLYGHLDKQPEMVGWQEGLGPWKPVRRSDKLYGRGGADDGYAAFASLTAIRALQLRGAAFARCVILIEACEESGSYDLPHYIDALAERIGNPSLVICLDSGCGNYEQLWCTTSLRGIITGDLVVEVLQEGVHSGDASGLVPSTFRILRHILSRLEDPATGRVIDSFHVEIPKARLEQAAACGQVLGPSVYERFPWLPGVRPMTTDLLDAVLNRTWRPALSVTGAEGLPPLDSAGNVLRPRTAVKLSLRVPPTMDVAAATERLTEILTADPPYGAKVSFHAEQGGAGWNAPELAPWLEAAAERASQTYFERPAVYMGEGGSIPFMGMLGAKFPKAQFLITGVLGPQSNAHGPNEFLHIPCGKRLTCCVAHVLAEHHGRAAAG